METTTGAPNQIKKSQSLAYKILSDDFPKVYKDLFDLYQALKGPD